jgi:hypothetical protein
MTKQAASPNTLTHGGDAYRLAVAAMQKWKDLNPRTRRLLVAVGVRERRMPGNTATILLDPSQTGGKQSSAARDAGETCAPPCGRGAVTRRSTTPSPP